MHTFIIGIAGGSGSGKSTVTQKIMEVAGSAHTAVIMQDNYYKDQSNLSMEQRARTNYDHPNAFDWPLMIAQINDLRHGVPIEMPVYDFPLHNRAAQTITVAPARVIVIEGLFALYEPALYTMMQLKIFVDTAADVRLIRRLRRDIAERGRSVESVLTQFETTVRPMHKQFIDPTKRCADVILPHGANDAAIDMITTKIASLIAQAKPSALD
jgi:uridine kinase